MAAKMVVLVYKWRCLETHTENQIYIANFLMTIFQYKRNSSSFFWSVHYDNEEQKLVYNIKNRMYRSVL